MTRLPVCKTGVFKQAGSDDWSITSASHQPSPRLRPGRPFGLAAQSAERPVVCGRVEGASPFGSAIFSECSSVFRAPGGRAQAPVLIPLTRRARAVDPSERGEQLDVAAFAVTLVVVWASFQDLASTMRNHKSLRYMLNPFNHLLAPARFFTRRMA